MRIDILNYINRTFLYKHLINTKYAAFQFHSDKKNGIEKILNYIPDQTSTSKVKQFSIYETTTNLFHEIKESFISKSLHSKKYNFYIDSYMLSWEFYPNRFMFMEENNGNYLIFKISDKIIILTPPENYDENLPLRIFREIYYREGIDHKALFFHAGAVESEGQGIMIIGPSGTGKTTFLTKACESGATNFITNDRVSIDSFSNIVTFPMQIRIGKENFKNLRLYDAFLYQRSIFKRIKDIDADEISSLGFKFELEPSVFCSLNNITHFPSIPLKTIVYPKLDLSLGSNYLIEKMDNKEALTILERELTNLEDYVWPEAWLVIPSPRISYQEKMHAICLDFLFLNITFGYNVDFNQLIKTILSYGKTN